jgi:predicted RNA binding protein YcfA (HicA-like mRNA interferase family)
MPELPKLGGRAVVKAFGRDGWELVRQKGSHMILVRDGSMVTYPCRIIEKLRRVRCAASFGRAA